MTFFIILLTISQIVGFYLIFNKVKPIIKPKTEGISSNSSDQITHEVLLSDTLPGICLKYGVTALEVRFF